MPGRPLHRRRWSLAGAELTVHDEISGSGWHDVSAFWHFPTGATVQADGAAVTVTVAGGTVRAEIAGSEPLRQRVESRPVASGFQATAPAPVLILTTAGELPLWLTTRWRLADGELADSAPAARQAGGG